MGKNTKQRYKVEFLKIITPLRENKICFSLFWGPSSARRAARSTHVCVPYLIRIVSEESRVKKKLKKCSMLFPGLLFLVADFAGKRSWRTQRLKNINLIKSCQNISLRLWSLNFIIMDGRNIFFRSLCLENGNLWVKASIKYIWRAIEAIDMDPV